jgi:hypothetical protein
LILALLFTFPPFFYLFDRIWAPTKILRNVFPFVEKLWERFLSAHDLICFNMEMSWDIRWVLSHMEKCERRWVWVYTPRLLVTAGRYPVRDSLPLRDTCCVSPLLKCFPLPIWTDAVGILPEGQEVKTCTIRSTLPGKSASKDYLIQIYRVQTPFQPTQRTDLLVIS